jgi:hypothetical protein
MERRNNIARMLAVRRILPLLAGILLLAGLASAQDPHTGTIAGAVRDENGNPVRGAAIIILNQQRGGFTDTTGVFTIRRVPPGTYTLRTAMVDRGRDERPGVEVAAGDTTHVDFMLPTYPEITAPVFTGNELPCDDVGEGDRDAGSLVQIGVRPASRIGVASVKEPGAFVYRYEVVNRSRGKIIEVRIGYDATRGICELTSEHGHVVPDTVLSPPGWVCVPVQAEGATEFALRWRLVRSESSEAIVPRSSRSGFAVVLRKRDALYSRSHWMTTGDSGWYSTGSLRPARELETIRMATGTIAGTITDSNGKPLPAAQVGIRHTGMEAISDSAGGFRITEIPVGDYILRANKPGFQGCRKGVRIAAGEATPIDFRLLGTTLSIPCEAYVTSRDRLDDPFPDRVVDTRGARFLERSSIVPAKSPDSKRPKPFIYSLTSREIEVVYRGLGEDTASRAFVATIHRTFQTPAEERLLRIAEETYPPSKAIALFADERLDRKALRREKRLWWYDQFDNVRIPFAVTGDAVRYYVALAQAFGSGDTARTHRWRMKHCQFEYSATVSRVPRFARYGREFDDVYVVEMKLSWFNYCGPVCALSFHLDRTVVLRADGTVLCVFGDRKPSIIVS